MGLSLRQWKVLIYAAPKVVAEVYSALPVIIPLVKHVLQALPTIVKLVNEVMKVVEELKLKEPQAGPGLHPEEIIERPHGMTPEEKELFDRMSRIE
jgi:hypothetical protein